MPLYEFQCTNEKCQETFEVDIKLRDLEKTTVHCPKCLERAKQIITPLRTKHVSWSSWRIGHDGH